MTDISQMQETDEPLEDARKYLVDYTEHIRTSNRMIENIVPIRWRDYEVLSLTIQDLLEHVQKLTKRIEELETN